MKLREARREEWKRKIYGDEEQYNINKVYVCCPADLVVGQSTEISPRNEKARKRVAAEEKLLDTVARFEILNEIFALLTGKATTKFRINQLLSKLVMSSSRVVYHLRYRFLSSSAF
jgi:hypothetical protein